MHPGGIIATQCISLGRHVPIPKGIVAAIRSTHDYGYNAIQIFPGNPKGWSHADLDPQVAMNSSHELALQNFAVAVIHAPYIINLATSDPLLQINSATCLRNSLKRASEIKAQFVVVHAGSHKGQGQEEGIARVADLIMSVYDDIPAGTQLLIENTAGAGDSLAGTPEKLGELLAALPSSVSACIDTAHLWGGGSDISTIDGVAVTIDELDKYIGRDRIPLFHLNDSKVELGSHRDVHEHLGEGHIGIEGIAAFANFLTTHDIPIILETPVEDEEAREIERRRIAHCLIKLDITGAEELLEQLRTETPAPAPKSDAADDK